MTPTGKSVGVKELSRLLSRLRHRQFGILITTSYLASQAYTELKEDKHPVVIISGIDIVDTLKSRIGSIEANIQVGQHPLNPQFFLSTTSTTLV